MPTICDDEAAANGRKVEELAELQRLRLALRLYARVAKSRLQLCKRSGVWEANIAAGWLTRRTEMRHQ